MKSDGPPVRVIREAQRLLTVLGYQPGPADGVWGGRTLEAWRAFLRDAGQPPADTLTPEALRALRSVGQRQGAGSAQAARPTPPVRRQVRPDGLHRAVQAGSLSGLQAALAAGVDVNARDARGWTALMHAVNKGYTLLVPPLLAAQADLNVRAADGATALFMAVLHGYTETVEALLKAGADHSIPGPRGRTVLEVVKMQEHPELTTLLEQAKQAALARSNTEVEIGRVFLDCPTCPQMVVVPAGIYRMGSTESDSEKPQHEVMIAKPLAVGVYEGTRREFGRFVQETGYAMGNSCHTYEGRKWELRSGRGWQNPGFSQTDLDPMVCVNWYDAQAYASWLSRETGHFYRLLSEAEWEYVTRAGTTTKYWWGNEIGRNRANCDGCGSQWDDKQTAPVGSFQPNRFGLYDVHGNVWEWVQDCWNGNYNDAPSDGRAWSTGDCSQRVLRGGSWLSEPRFLRSADRSRGTTDERDSDFGFRIARSLP